MGSILDNLTDDEKRKLIRGQKYSGDQVKLVGYAKHYRVRTKIEVLTHYGNGKLACVKCGFSDIRALCLDHINGGGTQDRKREASSGRGYVLGGSGLYSRLKVKGYPEGYQTLCSNCNAIKMITDDECSPEKRLSSLQRMR